MIILVVLLVTAYMVDAASMNKRDARQHLSDKRHCSELGGYCFKNRHCCGDPGYEPVIGPRCDYENHVCVLRQK